MTPGKHHWLAALTVALLIHGGVLALVLSQNSSAGRPGAR